MNSKNTPASSLSVASSVRCLLCGRPVTEESPCRYVGQPVHQKCYDDELAQKPWEVSLRRFYQKPVKAPFS